MNAYLPSLEGWIAAAPALAAAMAVIVFAVRTVWPVMRKIVHLVDDLAGEPERPGHPARPGVMERLQDHSDRLAVVEARTAELVPNGGGSIKDQIGHIGDRLDAVERCLGESRS